MELMQRVKGYSDSREEEEEEEAAEIITITREESSRLQQQDAASSNNFRKQLELMDMSLGRNKVEEEGNFQKGSGSGSGSGGVVGGCSTGTFPTHHASTNNNNIKEVEVEKEHMFDKVVTPSDVGKLNRLVIPKQHAEKYFPLDASSNEKGLLLNFEDRNGKLWRFRYSYWNSSQSYVMTKGWSRFVKEKKLDAGDIVSFQRGLGDLYRHKLYIDWRRRPDHAPADHHHPSPTLISPLFLPNHYSIRWGTGRLYSLPSPPPATSTMPPPHHDHFHHHLNSNHMYTFHHQQHHHHPHHQQYYGGGNNGNANGSHHNNYTDQLNSGSGSVYYLRSTPSMSMQMGDQNLPGQQQERGNIAPMIIDSVPVAHHHHHRGATTTATSTAGKRLRLFGVNMECASSPAEDPICLSSSASAPHVTLPNSLPSSSLPPPLRVPHEDPLSSSARFGDQRGTTSLLFDLDPSFQYRQ